MQFRLGAANCGPLSWYLRVGTLRPRRPELLISRAAIPKTRIFSVSKKANFTRKKGQLIVKKLVSKLWSRNQKILKWPQKQRKDWRTTKVAVKTPTFVHTLMATQISKSNIILILPRDLWDFKSTSKPIIQSIIVLLQIKQTMVSHSLTLKTLSTGHRTFTMTVSSSVFYFKSVSMLFSLTLSLFRVKITDLNVKISCRSRVDKFHCFHWRK